MTILKVTSTPQPHTGLVGQTKPTSTRLARRGRTTYAAAPTVDTARAPAAGSTPPGNAAATFAADLERQMTELRGYAVWLCSSSTLADDLIQETLLKAWVARDRFEPGTNFRAWCMTILRNVFFSYKRRSWRSQPLSEQMISDLASDHVDFDDRLDLLAVRNAMALLPCDQREALLLIGVGGQSYIEAAKLCDCAIGTLKSRVHRARLRLGVLMSENKAGFSSDAGLEPQAALKDLIDQAARITNQAGKVTARTDGAMTAVATAS